MAMTSNKENIIYEEDEEEDEVFFGEVSEKEKHKASKYAKRRTILFTPGFRDDRKLMRYTMDPARLAALVEESGAANSSVDETEAGSDNKENFCNREHVARDTIGDSPDTAENNGNNSNNAAFDVSGDLFDSVTETDGNEENTQSAKGSDAEINELINLVPQLDLSSEKDKPEVRQGVFCTDTNIINETSEIAEQSESLIMPEEKINCTNFAVHGTDCINMYEQPVESSVVKDGITNERFTTENSSKVLQKTPTAQLTESDKDVNETPTDQTRSNEGYVEETPVVHLKQLDNFVEETPTIQFKHSSDCIVETTIVQFQKPDNDAKEGTESLNVCREETPTVIVNEPKKCVEETPLAELKNGEKHLETPTIQLKYLDDDVHNTPTIQLQKHREDMSKDQEFDMEEIPFLKPVEYTEETPTIVFRKPEKCAEETPTIGFRNSDDNMEETPTIVFKNPVEDVEETPTIVFKKPEKCVEETPNIKFKNVVEDVEQTPPVVFKNPVETPTIVFKSPVEDVEETPTIVFKKPEKYVEEIQTGKIKKQEESIEEDTCIVQTFSNGDSSAEDFQTVSSKDINCQNTPTVKSKVVPNALQFGTPSEHQNGSCDETSTVNVKTNGINAVHSAPNSARIGFKRSSTSAFQTTPRQIDTTPTSFSLNMSTHDTVDANKVTECTSPSVIFKETNFSPTLKIKDVKRPNTLPMNLEMNSSQLSFDIHEREIMAQNVSSEELLKPFIAGETDEQYTDSGLPSTPTYLPMFQR